MRRTGTTPHAIVTIARQALPEWALAIQQRTSEGAMSTLSAAPPPGCARRSRHTLVAVVVACARALGQTRWAARVRLLGENHTSDPKHIFRTQTASPAPQVTLGVPVVPTHPAYARCPDTPYACSLSRHTLRMLVVPTHPTHARCPDTPSVRSVSEVRFSRQKLYFGSEAYFPDANRLASGVNSESSLAHQHHFTRTL